MIISDKYKFVFIEVPFTGSTAISAALRSDYDGKAIKFKYRNKYDNKHANYSEWMHVAKRDNKDYFIFASVRNPLDVIVSDYIKMKNDHNNEWNNPKERYENGGWITKDLLSKYTDIHDYNMDFSTYFMKYNHGIYVNWNLVGYSYFDYVIKFENLNNDFQEVLKYLSITSKGPLLMVNKTENKERFETYFTSNTRVRAVSVFGPYMQCWGYKFPNNWEIKKIDYYSNFKYRILNYAVNTMSRKILLNPYSPYISKIKKMVTYKK